MLTGSTWRAAALTEGAGARSAGWAHEVSSRKITVALQSRILVDRSNHLACSSFDRRDHVATQRKIAWIGHVDDGGDHPDVVALPGRTVAVHDRAHRHVIG